MTSNSDSNKASHDLSSEYISDGKIENAHCIQLKDGQQEVTGSLQNDNIDACLLPQLTRSDINRYRLKFHENLLLNILQNGYHKTYSELFNLIDYEKKQRMNSGNPSSSSSYWSIEPLTERHQLLYQIMIHLMNAEHSNHSNNIEDVYKEYLYIAGLFRLNVNDQWLLEMYLQKCLKIVTKGKYLQSLELYKQLQKKLEKHKTILQPSINPYDKHQMNIPLYIVCYEQICRIILTIYQPNKEYQMDELLSNLNEALKYAEKDEAEQNYITIIEYTKLLFNNNPEKLVEAYELLSKFYILNTNKYELAKLTTENGLLKYTTELNENDNYYNQLKLWYSISKSKLIESDYINIIIAGQYNSNDMLNLIKWKDTRSNLPLYDKDHFMKVTSKQYINNEVTAPFDR
ncbi:hypothetical protein Smp_151570 [Schistosoma mansoni]|uniref:hypothetical protein n=1 Tax=Schistosoma mansoni TaxID=6183 RepID=UPI00022DC6B7|nr:hypothetical protein Smp_151570 [Schistosoma mansoni]|eukprot:XP_018649501.1 hypothetical protein Smp_151570 [Schistosoma mansoni]